MAGEPHDLMIDILRDVPSTVAGIERRLHRPEGMLASQSAHLERQDARFEAVEARLQRVATTTHASMTLMQNYGDSDDRHKARPERLERRVGAIEDELRGH